MKNIPLSAGHGYALVSDEDYERLVRFKWHLTSHGYAYRAEKRGGKQTNYSMHREVLGAAAGRVVDHINGDKLDNRRENLRSATVAQNMCNSKPIQKTSAFKGVSWHSCRNRWRAVIKQGGKSRHIGYFLSESAAAAAYDDAAERQFGEFARTNSRRAG